MDEAGGNKKKFRMMDVILTVICVVFVAEAAAPAAEIGNSQFFWWILLIIAFLLPYGLISAELGTTYQGAGGIYDWVKRAFGDKWGTRVSWYYWVNFPLWMASLAVMFPITLNSAFGIQIGPVLSLIIELAFTWSIVFISFFPVCDSVWILNGAAVIKILLAVLVGGIGIYVACTQGMANVYTVKSLFPTLDLDSLSYVSVILFNFLGFEVVCTFADSMENPKKQIPGAIIAGGIVIAVIYIFSAFGIGVAIPTSEISGDTGILAAIQIMTNRQTGLFIQIVGLMFLATLFGNMTSWSLGVNNIACYAAENNNMPGIYARKAAKNDMPVGSSIMNGIVASCVILIAPLIPNEDLFWSLFAVNVVMILLAYLPVFPAFYKLRKINPDINRPFKVGGNDLVLKIMVVVPMILIGMALVFTAVPLRFDRASLMSTLPITIETVILVGIGELILHCTQKKKK